MYAVGGGRYPGQHIFYPNLYPGQHFLSSHTVKPSHMITSIKQSPVLKDHHFLALSYIISYELILFQEVTFLIRPLLLCLIGDLLKQF